MWVARQSAEEVAAVDQAEVAELVRLDDQHRREPAVTSRATGIRARSSRLRALKLLLRSCSAGSAVAWVGLLLAASLGVALFARPLGGLLLAAVTAASPRAPRCLG